MIVDFIRIMTFKIMVDLHDDTIRNKIIIDVKTTIYIVDENNNRGVIESFHTRNYRLIHVEDIANIQVLFYIFIQCEVLASYFLDQ